ncbi:MAG TPA: TetR/AcrR family transcriptional regulator C-terminal domain-containing protein [Mycobacterium sp.]|nr:TetR/AcrR family transcriptional regulator C-terminal domain-containing protein [Mycobacterium sp.]
MTSQSRSKHRQARDPLTRRRILEAALEIVDREGSTALTMRRLASELQVAAMSLYNHVRGREEILDGLSEVMVSEIGAERQAGPPRAVLEQFVHGIRAVALSHPEAFRLVGMRPLHTPEAFRPVEAALGALREMGFGHRDAAHAYRLLAAYARGFALAEIDGMTFEATPETPQDRRPGALDPQTFPHIVELADRLEHPDRDAAFAFATDTILTALEIRSTAQPRLF